MRINMSLKNQDLGYGKALPDNMFNYDISASTIHFTLDNGGHFDVKTSTQFLSIQNIDNVWCNEFICTYGANRRETEVKVDNLPLFFWLLMNEKKPAHATWNDSGLLKKLKKKDIYNGTKLLMLFQYISRHPESVLVKQVGNALEIIALGKSELITVERMRRVYASHVRFFSFAMKKIFESDNRKTIEALLHDRMQKNHYGASAATKSMLRL